MTRIRGALIGLTVVTATPAAADPLPGWPADARVAGVRFVEEEPAVTPDEAARAYPLFRERCAWRPQSMRDEVNGLATFADWAEACRAAEAAPSPSPAEAAAFFRHHFEPVLVQGGVTRLRVRDICPDAALAPFAGASRLDGSGRYVPMGAPVRFRATGDARIDRLWIVDAAAGESRSGPGDHYRMDLFADRACPQGAETNRQVTARVLVYLPRAAAARLRAGTEPPSPGPAAPPRAPDPSLPVVTMVAPPVPPSPSALPPRNAVAAGVRVAEDARALPPAEAAAAWPALREQCERRIRGDHQDLSGLTEAGDWRQACVEALFTPAPSPAEAAAALQRLFVPVAVDGGGAALRVSETCPDPTTSMFAGMGMLRGSSQYVPLGAPVRISGTRDGRFDRLWVVRRESAAGREGPRGHFELDLVAQGRVCPRFVELSDRRVPAEVLVYLPRPAAERLAIGGSGPPSRDDR